MTIIRKGAARVEGDQTQRATGAMILGTALDELEPTGKGTAPTTLCIGSGMGAATIIERV